METPCHISILRDFLKECKSLSISQISESVIYQNLNQPTSYNVHVKVNTIRASDRVVVNNATFNNISAISWRSVLLVEETGVPGEKNRPVAIH